MQNIKVNQTGTVVEVKPTPAETGNKPQEKYGLHFSSSIKITDPDTGKVIVQMRCS